MREKKKEYLQNNRQEFKRKMDSSEVTKKNREK